MPNNLSKTICVMIAGRAGAGKSTTSKLLRQIFLETYHWNVGQFAIATRVKEVAKAMGWDGKKDELGRQLLQYIGNTGRCYNKDIWVSHMLDNQVANDRCFPFDVILVDDYRYPSEAAYVRANGLYDVCEVRIHSPERELLKGLPNYDAPGECTLPEITVPESERYTYCIGNYGDIIDLTIACQTIAGNIVKNASIWH
jgi:hypothetical protein